MCCSLRADAIRPRRGQVFVASGLANKFSQFGAAALRSSSTFRTRRMIEAMISACAQRYSFLLAQQRRLLRYDYACALSTETWCDACAACSVTAIAVTARNGGSHDSGRGETVQATVSAMPTCLVHPCAGAPHAPWRQRLPNLPQQCASWNPSPPCAGTPPRALAADQAPCAAAGLVAACPAPREHSVAHRCPARPATL